MMHSEFQVGGKYVAKISGRLVTVRVDAIRETHEAGADQTVYDVTNLATGRRATLNSAAKFPFGCYAVDDNTKGHDDDSR